MKPRLKHSGLCNRARRTFLWCFTGVSVPEPGSVAPSCGRYGRLGDCRGSTRKSTVAAPSVPEPSTLVGTGTAALAGLMNAGLVAEEVSIRFCFGVTRPSPRRGRAPEGRVRGRARQKMLRPR